jgi:hypothetical protein
LKQGFKIMRKALICVLLVWKIVLVGLFGDTRLQAALDCIADQIIRA